MSLLSVEGGDPSRGPMWDDKRKVGILDDFDLTRAADQTGAGEKDKLGRYRSWRWIFCREGGLRGEIPRRHRHEAESSTWLLICLCLTTVLGKGGKNSIGESHPLSGWFQEAGASLG